MLTNNINVNDKYVTIGDNNNNYYVCLYCKKNIYFICSMVKCQTCKYFSHYFCFYSNMLSNNCLGMYEDVCIKCTYKLMPFANLNDIEMVDNINNYSINNCSIFSDINKSYFDLNNWPYDHDVNLYFNNQDLASFES